MYNNCFVQYTLQSLFFEVTTTALKIHCSCVGTCCGNINFPWLDYAPLHIEMLCGYL